MNMNTRDIVVVHIIIFFGIIFDFASEGRGRHQYIRKVLIFGAFFFRHNTLLVNIILNNIEQKDILV